MAQETTIGGKRLEDALHPALEAVLDDTGWRITELQRDVELNEGVAADCVVRVASGSSEAALVVEVDANPRPKTAREKAVLLKHLVAQSAGDHPSPIAFFVPHITPSLASLLTGLEVGYFDLAGACRLRWPGMYVERAASLKLPAMDAAPVLPDSPFSPGATKKHRIMRVLLSYPERRWHQVELAAEACVSVYTAHSVVEWLLAEHRADYEGRGPDRVVFLAAPGGLLETWSAFWASTWRRNQREARLYYCLGRSDEDVRERITRAATEVGARVGFTLAAGANRYGAYLRDELVHAYFTGSDAELAEAADLDPVPRGANVLLYVARDEGIFYLPAEARERLSLRAPSGIWPVSPVQLYLDMKAAGGRYAEQAEELRREVLRY